LLLIGIFACSTAAIMIKSCQVNSLLLASYRLLLASAILFPLFLRDLRKNRGCYSLKHVLRTIPPGLLMGMHFILWIIGTRLTSAANATLIVTMTPAITPFLLFLIAGEKVNRGEYLGTGLTLCGVLALCIGDFNIGRENLLGDILSFASMLFLACYLVLGKRNRNFPSVMLYVVPLYFFGGLVCFIIAMCRQVNPMDVDGSRGIMMIVGMAVIPTVIGHSILNYLMKHMRGQVVAVAGLGQFIFVGIMGYFILNEVPSIMFYPSCLLVVAGSVIALRATPESSPEEQ